MLTDINACDCTWECTDTIRESAVKVEFRRKIPLRTGQSNLRKRRDCPTLYRVNYIPTRIDLFGIYDRLRCA